MAKIFRSVRQSLVEDGNIKKYIRYAFGEIILVVLGILIALQIDTTYTNYQLEKTEVKYLKEIRNNLKFDVIDIQFNIDFNVKRLRSNLVVLQYLNKEIPYSDSVGFHLSNLPYSARTLPNNSTYETVKSKGLDIISNDSLRQRITTLYDFGYKNVIDFESKDDHQFQFGILLPEVVKSINVIAVWKVGRPINQDEILNNYPLKNAVTMNIHLRKYMLTYYKMLLRDVQLTVTAIENELETKE